MKPNHHHSSLSSPPAGNCRFFGWRFALASLLVLATAAWLAALEDQRTVAPMGVATPAGPRQADQQSARVASTTPEERHEILLCQALGPAAPYDIRGVDCAGCNCGRRWEAMRAIDWQAYAQGEYVGHARLAHVPEYRLRVDDQLDMTYRLTREETPTPYRLNVGDMIQVESFTDHEINHELLIQPDGTITLRLLGQVHATGRTVTQLRDALNEMYKSYYKNPAITVTPLKVNTKLEDLRATIDRRAGVGGQSQNVRVTPEGTVSLPAIGSVQAQGLTLTELQTELNESYRQVVEGIQVIPILVQRAPRFVYVLGEVNNPGRFDLTGPTTALQAIAMAGSWRVGSNLRQIVVFRRGDDWRLLATIINLDGALFGNQPCPRGEIWIDDSDVIIVPKSKILIADDFIDLVFTRGLYGVFPVTTTLQFTKLSTL
jgi:polysaccharide biosynthesis/export protein